MPRINEHKFELNNEEYLLTWYDKPRLTKNGLKQEVKSLLREYITKNNLPIQIVNSNGNDEVPWTLARKILEHFSNNTFKIKKVSKSIKLDSKSITTNSNSNSNPSNTNDNNLTLNKDRIYLIPCSSSKILKKELENKKFKFENLEFNNELGEFRKIIFDKIQNAKSHKRKKNNSLIYISNSFDLEFTAQAHKLYSKGNLYHSNSSDSLNWSQKEKEKIYIVSALFGIIRADNYIPLYDLAMTDEIDTNKNYAQRFWKGKLDSIIEKLNDEGFIIYNILSNPYNVCINKQHITVIPKMNWKDNWGKHKGVWLKEKL